MIPKQDCAECKNLPEGEVTAGHEHSLPSPFTEFDYNAHRDATTVVAMKKIWKVFADSADLIVFDSKATKEQIIECEAQVAQKILEVLIECKVPDCDMKYLIESFQVTFHQVFTVLGRQKFEIEKEYLARCIGAKDPGMPNKFSREFATIGDLFKKVTEIRNEQDPNGDNGSYFNVNK